MLPIPIYYVPDEKVVVDSTGFPVQEEKYPGAAITVDALLKITLFDSSQSTTGYTGFDGCTTFKANFDYNYDHDIDPPIRVLDADINTSGDWADVDVSNGKLSVRMNFDNADLITWATDGNEEKQTTGGVEIQGFTDGKLTGWVRIPFYIYNLQDYSSSPVSTPEDYYTDTEVDALLADYLLKQSPDDLTFTDDTKGVRWSPDDTDIRMVGYVDDGVVTIDVNEVV